MLRKISVISLILLFAVPMMSSAQNRPTRPPDKNITFNPVTRKWEDISGNITLSGPDSHIDMFFGNWQESMPKHTHGSLVERDILTKGDSMHPPTRGAVLEYVNRFTYATLFAHNTTEPTTLEGEQEIFFILSGKGIIKAGEKEADLYSGICILMPAGLTFTITNTGDEQLTMYLVSEPIPDGFSPNKEMQVKDENAMPLDSSDAHWCGLVKSLYGKADGTGILTSVLTCAFSPMTFFHPHVHFEGCEEVWTTIDDSIYVLLGKQIRLQTPGTAYMIPTDGNTPHANFNVSDKTVKMFYFSVRKDRE